MLKLKWGQLLVKMKKILEKKRFRKFDFTLILFAILIIFGTAVGVYAFAASSSQNVNPGLNTCNSFQSPWLKPNVQTNVYPEGQNSESRVCVVSSNFFGFSCVNYGEGNFNKLTCGK